MLMNMKELLAVANEHNFAIPAFNIGTGQMLTGIIASAKLRVSGYPGYPSERVKIPG